MNNFSFQKQNNGKYTIKNVPIMEHISSDNYNFDEKYFDEAIKKHNKLKSNGYQPRLILGHTDDDSNGPGPEVVGFVSDLKYSKQHKQLIADFSDIDEITKQQIENNKYPGRSAEAKISTPEISNVALLAGDPPAIKLPDMKFSNKEKTMSILFYPKNDTVKLSEDITPDPLTNNTEEVSQAEKNDFEKFEKYMTMLAKKWADESEDKGDEDEEKLSEDKEDKDEEKLSEDKEDKEDKDSKDSKEDAEKNKDEDEDKDKEIKKMSEKIANLEKINLRNALLEIKFSESKFGAKITKEDFISLMEKLPVSAHDDTIKMLIKSNTPSTLKFSEKEMIDSKKPKNYESEIKEYYEKNKQKYRGDIFAARRDFLKSK